MSQAFEKIVSICLHTTIDGGLGTLIANLVNGFFMLHETSANKSLTQMIIATIAQACITMVSAEECRNLLWNNPQDDPTGGVAFIVTLFQQPTLWARVSAIYAEIFSSFMKNKNDQANPDNKVTE